MKYKLLFISALVLCLSACGGSGRTAAPVANIQISDVWMNMSELEAGDRSAPIHLTLTNNGGTAVGQLMLAQTPIVTSSDVVNATQLRNGTERVAMIEVPINGSVEFTPRGYHITVSSLPPTIKAGDTFPLTLAFASGDRRIVDVIVRP